MHVVEIVDEIVIWDKFVINELTLLVDNRVQELSPFALAFRLVSALAIVASAQSPSGGSRGLQILAPSSP